MILALSRFSHNRPACGEQSRQPHTADISHKAISDRLKGLPGLPAGAATTYQGMLILDMFYF